MIEVVCAIIAAISAIMVAVVGKKADIATKKSEARAELRRRESLLQLELMNSNTQLTQAIGNAILGGHNNGNVQIAKDNVEKALNNYQAFHNEIIAHQVSK